MERDLIAIGAEHRVYRTSLRSGWVLKKPTAINWLCLRLMKKGAGQIRKELKDSSRLVEGKNIVIPESRIFSFNRGKDYIILQRYIEPTPSSIDWINYLKANQGDFLYYKYLLSPRNFIPRGDTLYWVDFTLGLTGRWIDHTKIASPRSIPRLRAAILGFMRLRR